jgi:hypothetical protein
MEMDPQLDAILATTIADFRKLKTMGEKTFAQLGEEDFHYQLNTDQNSIAVIVKHLAGNMLSRWTDFLTSDGEKPDRNRDQEFVEERLSKARLMEMWDRGWKCTFDALTPLKGEDLGKTIVIRGEPMSVFAAINRQTSHYAYHIGQIVLLAKHIRGGEWKYLTIPRGQSEQFNQQIEKRPSR